LEPILQLLAVHQDSAVRADAAWILGGYRTADAKVVRGLVRALNDDRDVRGEAATALAIIGRPTFPLVAEYLKDRHGKGRANALWVVANAQLEPGGKPRDIPTLIEVLQEIISTDPKDQMREGGVDALGHLGAQARAALPALRAALNDRSVFVKIGAAQAIMEVDPNNQEVLPFLLKAIRSTDPVTRCLAATALERFGSRAKPAVPELIKGLRDKDPNVRSTHLAALAAIGPAAVSAIPEIEKIIKGDIPGNKESAAQALESISARPEDPCNPLGASFALPGLTAAGDISTTVYDAAGNLIRPRAAGALHS
jgi:HEAT repeat protein